MTVLLDSTPVDSGPGGLTLSTASGERHVSADRIIVAVGRRPNTDAIGLESLGVDAAANGLIVVAPNMLATRHIAAIGDVAPGPSLAHKAMREGVVAAEALSGLPAEMDAVIPQVVFSDPEVAVVGITAAEAKAAGLSVRSGTFPFTASGRALMLGASTGSATIVSDRATDRILGVQLVGQHASELIGEATLAIEMMAVTGDIAGMIHPHPTLSETLGEAAALLRGQPIHTFA